MRTETEKRERVSAPAAVEIRESATGDGPRLDATLIVEGRAASGGRREVFAPGSLVWADSGVDVLGEHGGEPLARAIPARGARGEIRISTPATPEIVETVRSGRKWASVEFVALETRETRGGVREILRAWLPAAALVADPEYDTTRAEIRKRRSRRRRLWL